VTAPETGKAEGPSADDYALVAETAAEVQAPDLPYRPPMPRDRGGAIAPERGATAIFPTRITNDLASLLSDSDVSTLDLTGAPAAV
jgi:hypothetical protein